MKDIHTYTQTLMVEDSKSINFDSSTTTLCRYTGKTPTLPGPHRRVTAVKLNTASSCPEAQQSIAESANAMRPLQHEYKTAAVAESEAQEPTCTGAIEQQPEFAQWGSYCIG